MFVHFGLQFGEMLFYPLGSSQQLRWEITTIHRLNNNPNVLVPAGRQILMVVPRGKIKMADDFLYRIFLSRSTTGSYGNSFQVERKARKYIPKEYNLPVEKPPPFITIHTYKRFRIFLFLLYSKGGVRLGGRRIFRKKHFH